MRTATDVPALPEVLRVHPHARVLVAPVVVLLLGLGLAGYGAAVVAPDAVVARVAGSVVLAAVLLRFSVLPWLRWLSTVLVMTHDVVEVRTGVLRRRRRALPLDVVARVSVELPSRLGRAGTLVVEPTGPVAPLVVPRVPRVRDVAEHLADLLDAQR